MSGKLSLFLKSHRFNEAAATCGGKLVDGILHGHVPRGFNEAAATCGGKPALAISATPACGASMRPPQLAAENGKLPGGAYQALNLLQ